MKKLTPQELNTLVNNIIGLDNLSNTNFDSQKQSLKNTYFKGVN